MNGTTVLGVFASRAIYVVLSDSELNRGSEPVDRPDVFMPLFIGDYLAGTSRLTTELHGAYMLLIMDYWMNGPPPDNDQILASITKMAPDAWSNARASLEHYFSIDQGCWRHKRIDHELGVACEKKQAAKDKAEKAAAARWGNKPKTGKEPKIDASSNAPSIPQAMHKECPSPSPSPTEPKGSEERDGAANAPPPDQPKKSKRGTRLPDDWELTPEYVQAARELRPDLLPYLDNVASKFADHWHSKSGQGATKLDWLATWRNWLRNEKPGGNHATTQQHSGQPKENALRRIERQARQVFADAEAEEAGLCDVGADGPVVWPQVVEPGG